MQTASTATIDLVSVSLEIHYFMSLKYAAFSKI